jgi:hypothetical protein
LVYCGFITQYTKIASQFEKNGQPVGKYASPLTITGFINQYIYLLPCGGK